MMNAISPNLGMRMRARYARPYSDTPEAPVSDTARKRAPEQVWLQVAIKCRELLEILNLPRTHARTNTEAWSHVGRTKKRFPDAPADLYKDLREKWVHEDALINQRVTWMLNAQALFFGAFGLIAKTRLDFDAKLDLRRAEHFWYAFSPYSVAECIVLVLGLTVALYLRSGIFAAVEAMWVIKLRLRLHQRAHRIWRGLNVDVLRKTTKNGATPSKVMSDVFVLAWLVLATYEAARLTLPFLFPSLPIR